jgi:probable DNA repair protein
LHDEQFPQEPRPNPFLPLAIQRERKMPHATPESEAEYADTVLRRLIASANEVRLSWSATDGEKSFQPSPLLEKFHAEPVPAILLDPTLRRWHQRAALESLLDETAPPLAAEGIQSGGAKLLKAVAECPFKAFALYRLKASPLEDAEFGVSAAEKGTTVHRALDAIWNELGSQDTLLALSEEQTRDLIRRHVAAALDAPTLFRNLEQTRLERLIGEFLALERNRPRFTVRCREDERTVAVGGINLHIRVDREDELPDGRLVLIDYKTGKVKTDGWEGERLREPQLPLYAMNVRAPLAAVTLATIRTGETGFTGIQKDDVLGSAKQMRIDRDSIAEQRIHWTAALNRLATEFREGVARVDPLHHACNFCGLDALCRIHDYSTPEAADAGE